MLRDAAIRWVRTNCTSQRFQTAFVHDLDEAISLSVNCSFIIGGALTRIFKPYLLHWFADELFIFQLTPQQAARLGIAPKEARFRCDHESVPDSPPAVACLSLDRLELEQPILSDWKRPIVAKCDYRVTGNVPADVALRMDFSQGANDGIRTFCQFAFPHVAPSATGTIRAEFEPGNLLPGTKLNAVMAVFIRCYASSKEPAIRWSPISNPVAAMLELAENFQQMP